MDYDFSRLSTRSFEQLIQALAVAVIGPGIVVFGDGPDGGREATFDGRLPFPNSAAPWHGYGVVQAKFRQRCENSGRDGDWALAELKKELGKFSDTRRKLREPDYYVFATNVVLSPVAEQGGKDKVTAWLDEQKAVLGFKDYRIWDYDQLRVLLDAHEGVRTAYAAWITPGDVLAAVLKQIQPRQADFRPLMLTSLQKELLAEQYVNLGQAGHQAQDRTPLAQVFVDLPINLPVENGFPFAVNAVQSLLELAAQRLDPASNPGKSAEYASQIPGRVVFIGGPGQGKSTLTQFLCQIHRVALLDGLALLPEARDACELIRRQCAQENLALPAMARFPVRVELNRFATALAENQVASLFDYLRQRLGRHGEQALLADDLRAWLGAYPWLLVLDGLDEVPSSSNRDQVMKAVEGFLVDAHACNADLLLLTTTRPQGYNDDFSPRYYHHHQLLALEVPQALHYAGRLIGQRWSGDADKQQMLMERMQRAGAEDATARLMRSPLQVTIMALLVESVGQPPKERWRLFNDYYQVIFRREKERNIPAAALLNTYQADIDAIHQQVGLELQKDSEQSGGTEALLPRETFAQLVARRLEKEGHGGADKERLQQDIIDAALDRLVFLVAPEQDKIGFEIRSLQEFMAAQCLMNGSDEDVRYRLRAIAPAAHWRNVFLFAAGRCFHEKQHLRDSLYTLCGELNESEVGRELEAAILAGSRLALDILEDGALANQPAQLKVFARLALRLLELPPCDDQRRLAQLYQPELADIFREEIEKRLAQHLLERRLGAWQTLLQLLCRNVDWAQDLAERAWPEEAATALQIAAATVSNPENASVWLAQCWFAAIPHLPPGEVDWDVCKKGRLADLAGDYPPPWLRALAATPLDNDVGIRIDGIHEDFHLTLYEFRDAEDFTALEEPATDAAHWAWGWLVAARNFSHHPSKEGLAALLERWQAATADEVEPVLGVFGQTCPWPLRACLTVVRDGVALSDIIVAVRCGDLGDGPDWMMAQQRWREHGINRGDLVYQPEAGLPFDLRIFELGFPFPGSNARYALGDHRLEIIEALYALWDGLPVSPAKKSLAGNLLFVLGVADERSISWNALTVSRLRDLFDSAQTEAVYVDLLRTIPEAFWQETNAATELARLGDCALFWSELAWENSDDKLDRLTLHYPKQGGLWRLLAIKCITGYRPTLAGLATDMAAFTEPRHRAAVLIVRLAQGYRDSTMAAALAELNANTQAVEQALAVLKREGDGEENAAFWLKLLDSLPADAWQARRDIVEAIRQQQRHRLSDFQHHSFFPA